MMPATPPNINWSGVSRVILGSKSWSRKTLLREVKAPAFDIIVPAIDERAIKRDSARDLVLAIAVAKARALVTRGEVVVAGPRASDSTAGPSPTGKTLLICGDAVVTHKGAILGKPRDVEEAWAFLRSYADAPVTTVCSVVVVDVGRRVFWSGVDEAEVYFRPLHDEVIGRVIDDGALESAGGLRIEHVAIQPFIDCVVGHVSAVMGFSQPVLADLVQRALSDHPSGEKLI